MLVDLIDRSLWAQNDCVYRSGCTVVVIYVSMCERVVVKLHAATLRDRILV